MASTEKHEADVRRDRRDHTAPRRRYEALVEVGSASVGGFEAEAVDVSLDGMRVRTAYVPRDGERVCCRFDGYGGEITVEGEVTWTRREARGGEFGVRFTGLDRRGMRILEDLCGPEFEEEEEPSAPAPVSEDQPGTRVRLHISGLGSPMRARVRDGAPGEVLVGSNLEFLKVGRDLELENVERGRQRAARIEHVGVEIDPETQVPQLVVALSYGDPDAEARPPARRAPRPEPEPRVEARVQPRREERAARPAERRPAPTVRSEPRYEAPEEDDFEDDEDLTTAPIRVRRRVEDTTPEPQVIDREPRVARSIDREPADLPEEMTPSAHVRMAQVPETPPPAQASEPLEEPLDDLREELEHDEDAPEDVSANTPPMAKVTRAAGQMKDRLEPGLAAAATGAKKAFGKVWGAVAAKRDALREKREQKDGPKRRTAPPPGKRGVTATKKGRLRRQHGAPVEAEIDDESIVEGGDRKRAIFSGAVGLMAVVAIYFASSSLRGGGVEAEADPALAASASAAPAASVSATPTLNGDNPVATAKVPLFGATPLSTTEAVPVPPQFEDGKKVDVDPGAGKEPSKDAAAFGDLVKDWGIGEVIEPNVFRFRMDGNVDGFVGKETEDGFKLVLPGRISISTGAGLKRKDGRLKEATVVNYPDRAEIIFTYHREVPAFAARAQGKRIILEVGTKRAKKKKDDEKSKKKK